MNELLKTMYDCFCNTRPSDELLADIERCHDALIEKLDKPERTLVPEIIDSKDNIAERMSIDSFICGFHLAWTLSNELNMYKQTPQNQKSDSGAFAVYEGKCCAE